MSTKLEIRDRICELVEEACKLIHKLEMSEEFNVKMYILKETEDFVKAIRVAKRKSAYKSLRKNFLEESMEYMESIIEELRKMHREVKSYIVGGVEFIEHEEVIGVAYLRDTYDWQKFLGVIYHTFKKPITFMVRRTNEREMELKIRWNLEVMKKTDDYYKCLVPYEDQLEMSLKKLEWSMFN